LNKLNIFLKCWQPLGGGFQRKRSVVITDWNCPPKQEKVLDVGRKFCAVGTDRRDFS